MLESEYCFEWLYFGKKLTNFIKTFLTGQVDVFAVASSGKRKKSLSLICLFLCLVLGLAEVAYSIGVAVKLALEWKDCKVLPGLFSTQAGNILNIAIADSRFCDKSLFQVLCLVQKPTGFAQFLFSTNVTKEHCNTCFVHVERRAFSVCTECFVFVTIGLQRSYQSKVQFFSSWAPCFFQ